MSTGDVGFGNGVYLTKLKPESTTKIEIAKNNWVNTSTRSINKVQNYFVLKIPDSDVKDSGAKDRNIFLFGKRTDLLLHKYPWWLKDYDSGQIIASYRYQVTSLGPASSKHDRYMGNYIMTEDTVNGRPVYKSQKATEDYLFMGSQGIWIVGTDFGQDKGFLVQRSKYSLGPDRNLPWEYNDIVSNQWSTDDDTLKATPWQM